MMTLAFWQSQWASFSAYTAQLLHDGSSHVVSVATGDFSWERVGRRWRRRTAAFFHSCGQAIVGAGQAVANLVSPSKIKSRPTTTQTTTSNAAADGAWTSPGAIRVSALLCCFLFFLYLSSLILPCCPNVSPHPLPALPSMLSERGFVCGCARYIASEAASANDTFSPQTVQDSNRPTTNACSTSILILLHPFYYSFFFLCFGSFLAFVR